MANIKAQPNHLETNLNEIMHPPLERVASGSKFEITLRMSRTKEVFYQPNCGHVL